MSDPITQTEQISLLEANEATATANGTGVDISDYIGKLDIVADTQLGGGTTPTMDYSIEHSDDDGSSDAYAAIPAAALSGTFTQVTDSADVFEALNLDTRYVKAWIRVVETLTGTLPTFVRSVTARGRKQVAS